MNTIEIYGIKIQFDLIIGQAGIWSKNGGTEPTHNDIEIIEHEITDIYDLADAMPEVTLAEAADPWLFEKKIKERFFHELIAAATEQNNQDRAADMADAADAFDAAIGG